jgi:deoxyribodipyrimidine photo-lyase
MSTAIVWLRRDLRLHDNPALHTAAERHERLLPVYVHAPEEEAPWAPGAASRWWLHHSLAALAAALRGIGLPLVIVRGPSLDALRGVIAATGATAVYWNRLYEPAAIERDRRVKDALREQGLDCESSNAALLAEPWTVKTSSGGPYRVFTPFWRAASAHLEGLPPPLPVPPRLQAPRQTPPSLPLDELQLLPRIAWDEGLRAQWQPGESGALAALERFCEDGVAGYRGLRDRPAVAGTSQLSPALHFGEIGPRQIVWRLRRLESGHAGDAAAESTAAYRRELGWREFAHHLLFHFPHTADAPLDRRFERLAWRRPRDYAADLRAWQRGRSGIPLVDAGMRQLWTTGWMHNRVRMIVASLLTKNLLVPWQEGARWFWDTLVDADLANNTLGWQWTAGCGADAAPYFRIFNPVLQGTRFDPQGEYLRSWVPELSLLSDDAIHAPWQARPAALTAAGFEPGRDYPLPIVDLATSRRRALAAYEPLRKLPH